MKKIALLLLATIISIGLVACSGETTKEEKEVSSVNSSDKNKEKANVDEEKDDEQAEENVQEFNQVIVDNDTFKATLTSVEKIVDKEWDEERIEVTFEVENKRDETIEIQAREVSADGKMIDESMLMMSQEVAGSKKADAVLVIQNYDGDLPKIEEDLEMKLNVFSWDNMDLEELYDVKIEFK